MAVKASPILAPLVATKQLADVRPLPAVIDQIRLREEIIKQFSLAEMKDLCERLRIDYEDISGDTRSAKALELVGYFKRRNRLPQVLTMCRQLRPNGNWQ
jgi:hypothetical protein